MTKRDSQTSNLNDLPIQETTKATDEQQAEQVRGGKVSLQDFHFVQRNNSASPTL
ncbi:MAG TPA: hypothetical protein VKA84_08110 [Gemmatimonadaceae bacterium]|nr:hypothetical protein [Gemmatimonadaceae bacterium]